MTGEPAGAVRRQLLAVATMAWLAGCATLPDARPPSGAEPQVWRGRFALTVEPNDRVADGQRSSGSFELTHADSFTELALRSPLGNTLAAARSDARGATRTTADGRIERAASTDELTERLFGWPIPELRLPAWLSGQVAGNESGWQVRVDARSDAGPSRLTIVYPQRVTLRLIVDER